MSEEVPKPHELAVIGLKGALEELEELFDDKPGWDMKWKVASVKAKVRQALLLMGELDV